MFQEYSVMSFTPGRLGVKILPPDDSRHWILLHATEYFPFATIPWIRYAAMRAKGWRY
jgi:hypothetical protein